MHLLPQPDSPSQGILTLAYGVEKYIEMAKTLGRSLALHVSDMPRAIVTDSPDAELAALFDQVISFRPEYGSNVRQKLYLDRYSPFEQTIFIDSDCIVVRNLQFVFEVFAGKSFGVVGGRWLYANHKDAFVNVERVLTHFQLDRLPKFNGGLYYFNQSDTTTAIFETARQLLAEFKDLGFAEFRGDGPNEEPLLAVAMSLHNQTMLQDQGQIMRTPVGLRGRLQLDVLAGECSFLKRDRLVSPAVVHFAYIWNDHPIYYREAAKLKQLDLNYPSLVASRPRFTEAIGLNLHYRLKLLKYACKRLVHRSKAIWSHIACL